MNLMSITPKSSWPWVRTLLHSVFDQADAESVAAQYHRMLDALTEKLPKVAGHLDAARADLLSFTAFPGSISSSSVKERWRFRKRCGRRSWRGRSRRRVCV